MVRSRKSCVSHHVDRVEISVRRRVVSGIRIVFITIVMESDAVELFKWISNLATRRGQATIQRHAIHWPRSTNIDALTLLHIAEINGVNTAALIRHDGRLHVSNQSPLRGSKEWMSLDIRRACARAKTTVLILDE